MMWFARVGRRDIHIAGKKTTPARMGDGAGIQYPQEPAGEPDVRHFRNRQDVSGARNLPSRLPGSLTTVIISEKTGHEKAGISSR